MKNKSHFKINLSEWALKHQSLTRYFMVVLIIAGLAAYFNLGRKEDPEFTIKIIVVRANWPGATAREVEQQVTDRIEKKLQEVPFLDNITSYSKAGESMIFLELKEYTDAKAVPDIWHKVREKVSDIRGQLPEGVNGPFFNDEFGDTFGSIYAFTGDGFSYAEVKKQVDRVRQELLAIPNVNKVELVGEQAEKIYIEMANDKLASLGIDPLQVANILKAQNAMTPAGSVVTKTDNIYLRVSGDFKSVESIRAIGIRANGRELKLGDVARVYRGYEDPPTYKMRFNGKEAIGLSISMAKGGDVLALGEALSQSIQRIQNELPVGMLIHQVSDQPKVVKNSINEFMKSLLEALIIVLAVSLISLGWRIGIVVAFSIPIVLCATFLTMKLFNIDLQRISLGALIIALGLLVDDAIIAVEMMALKLEQGWSRMRAATFAYESTAFPMLTGTLITSAGFLPVGFAKSNAGEYVFTLFAVVSVALIASWFVAVIFIPYLGFKLLPESLREEHLDEATIYNTRFYRVFKKILGGCLTYPKTVIVVTLAAFVLSIVSFKLVEKQFFPSSARPEILVDLWLPEGTVFRETERTAQIVESLLQKDADIVNYATYVGAGSPRFYLPLKPELMNLNFSQMVIMTKGLEERERVLKKLKQHFQTNSAFAHVRARATRLENGPPVGYPVSFRVSGEDPRQLRELSEQIATIMRQNPSTLNVNMTWNEMIKVTKLEIDQEKARALGISSQNLAQNVQTLLRGVAITQFREDDKLIEIVVRTDEPNRNSLERLKSLTVYTNNGKYVPLSQIAHFTYEFEEPIIHRRNRYPMITVRADIKDGVQAPDVTNQIWPALQPLIQKLPVNYKIEIAGSAEASGKSQASIAAVVPMTIFVIVTLLMIQLQSVQRTVIVILSAPLGMIGVTFFLLLLNFPFGFVANLGVLALFGMIMRNSVILVDQIEQDIKAGYTPFEAVQGAAVRRFRPIMLTAFAAILAMIPLTRSTFWGPMAVAIMGGLFVATVLTLLFLPALYVVWFKIKPTVSLQK